MISECLKQGLQNPLKPYKKTFRFLFDIEKLLAFHQTEKVTLLTRPCLGIANNRQKLCNKDFLSAQRTQAACPTAGKNKKRNTASIKGLHKLPDAAIPLWKRILDVTCIAMSMPALLPLSIVVALTVKVVSSGPVLFSQERIGYSGQRFRCWKFRSMKVNADSASHRDHTVLLMRSASPWSKMDKSDPRVIPFGSLLRATGLDELPQLINVLRGDMSIVGPRPCTPYEFTHYLPWQKERLNALPGLTGLWQVNGKNKTTFDEMVNWDIHYVRNMSVWMDLKIMCRTIPALQTQVVELILNSTTKLTKNIAVKNIHNNV